MAIDPNIPLQAGTGAAAPQNPLAMAGQAVGIANAMGQNRLQGVQTDTAQQGLSATRLQALGGIAGSALSLHDPNNPASVNEVVRALHAGLDAAGAQGTIDPQTIAALNKGIAQTTGPNDLLARVKQFALLGTPNNTALDRIYGAPGTQSTGQSVQPGVVSNPMFSRPFQPVGGAVDQYPSRSDLNERVIVGYDAKQNPIYGPKAQVTPPSLGGPAAATTPSPMGDGRLPPGLRNPANVTPPTTGNVTAPGAGTTAALSATGTQSATHFQGISDAGTQAQSQEAILANMQTEAAQFTQGPGQERIKNFQAAALRFANPIARAFGIDEKTVAANQSFDKLAAQIADAQGAKSDARLQVTQAANPSSALTPAGVDLILKQLRGNADYLRSRAKLAAAWPDKSDREGFESQIGANLDPQVFQFQRLDGAQQRAFLAGIKDGRDKDAFKANHAWALGQGLLTNAGR